MEAHAPRCVDSHLRDPTLPPWSTTPIPTIYLGPTQPWESSRQVKACTPFRCLPEDRFHHRVAKHGRKQEVRSQHVLLIKAVWSTAPMKSTGSLNWIPHNMRVDRLVKHALDEPLAHRI
jgi:hypothetical protein